MIELSSLICACANQQSQDPRAPTPLLASKQTYLFHF